MADKTSKEAWDFESIAIVLIILIVVGFSAWELINLIKKFLSPTPPPGTQAQSDTQKQSAVDAVTYNNNNTTLSDIDAVNCSNNIYDTINDQSWYWPAYDSSVAKLFTELQLIKNQDDANKVVKDFGLKKYSVFGFSAGKTYTLDEMLSDILNESDLATARGYLYEMQSITPNSNAPMNDGTGLDKKTTIPGTNITGYLNDDGTYSDSDGNIYDEDGNLISYPTA